jgi:hypothetical protein
VFGHLLGVHHFANRQADLSSRAQMRPLAADLRLDAEKFLLGRKQKRLALARALHGYDLATKSCLNP